MSEVALFIHSTATGPFMWRPLLAELPDAYDALLDQAENAPTPQERLNLLSQAERMLVEDELPILPIFQYVQLYLFDPHTITGISSHPRMEQQMHRIDVFGDRQGAVHRKFETAFRLVVDHVAHRSPRFS